MTFKNSGKKCNKCKQWKGFVSFGHDRTRPDGWNSACKQCKKESAEGRKRSAAANTMVALSPEQRERMRVFGDVVEAPRRIRGATDEDRRRLEVLHKVEDKRLAEPTLEQYFFGHQ